jgi:hypothetical protein
MKFKVGDRVKYTKNLEDPSNSWKIPLEVVGTITAIIKEKPCNIKVAYETKRIDTNWFAEDELELV